MQASSTSQLKRVLLAKLFLKVRLLTDADVITWGLF